MCNPAAPKPIGGKKLVCKQTHKTTQEQRPADSLMRGDAERKKETGSRWVVRSLPVMIMSPGGQKPWSGLMRTLPNDRSYRTLTLFVELVKDVETSKRDAQHFLTPGHWLSPLEVPTGSPHALVPLGDSYFTPVSAAVVTCCPLSCQGHLEEDDKICILGRFRLVSSYWRHLWGISFKSLSMSRPLWLYSAKNEGRPTSLSWHERMTSLLDPLARCKHEYSTWMLVWLKLVRTVTCDANASWRHEKGKYRKKNQCLNKSNFYQTNRPIPPTRCSSCLEFGNQPSAWDEIISFTKKSRRQCSQRGILETNCSCLLIQQPCCSSALSFFFLLV